MRGMVQNRERQPDELNPERAANLRPQQFAQGEGVTVDHLSRRDGRGKQELQWIFIAVARKGEAGVGGGIRFEPDVHAEENEERETWREEQPPFAGPQSRHHSRQAAGETDHADNPRARRVRVA